MARKVQTVKITADGRDKGKAFVLTEMPAVQAEKWATRALLALSRAGIDIPSDYATMGAAAIAAMGLQSIGSLSFADAEPLLDEMMTCVQIMPDASNPAIVRPLFGNDDIEEVSTLLRLRSEVVALHVGFSIHGEISKMRERGKASAAA